MPSPVRSMHASVSMDAIIVNYLTTCPIAPGSYS